MDWNAATERSIELLLLQVGHASTIVTVTVWQKDGYTISLFLRNRLNRTLPFFVFVI